MTGTVLISMLALVLAGKAEAQFPRTNVFADLRVPHIASTRVDENTVASPSNAKASTISVPTVAASQPIPASPSPKSDSVWNGVLIGAAIGGLLGLIPDHLDDCEECHDSLYGSIAVGAGIGLVVDLLRRPKPSPFPEATNDRVWLDLSLGRRAVGVRGRVVWR